MKTFSQYLNEAFTDSYPYQMSRDKHTDYMHKQRFHFSDPAGNYYEVDLEYIIPDNMISVEFSANYSMYASKSAPNPVKVFATIGTQLRSFIANYPDAKVMFIALENEPSRLRLYGALANRIAGTLGKTVSHKISKKANIWQIG